jgi:1-aminocyclopropane-1-carboxylate deaminase
VNQADTFWESAPQTPLQLVEAPLFDDLGIQLYIKRDDLIHPFVSGNKWRKLKFNLLEAKQQGFEKLLTFGGAYSNHLAAVAAAGQRLGFETIGIVRGDELTPASNATLNFVTQCGMQLVFVTREAYRNKEELALRYGPDCYVLPEGGTNALAVKGVGEVVTEITAQLGRVPTYLCTPVGTGGTLSGLCANASPDTRVLGFSAIKNGQYLLPTINALISQAAGFEKVNYEIFWEAHWGGYGKTTSELMTFIQNFENQTGILLEQVYTGKMMYQIFDFLRPEGAYFKPGDVVVALHTGGLQGRSKALDKS